MCKANCAVIQMLYSWITERLSAYLPIKTTSFDKILLLDLVKALLLRRYLVYTFYSMPPDPKKIQALRSSGALNRHPEKVRHPLFCEHDFFDPHDMVQVKYETVRAIEFDSRPIAQAALDFGLSRPTIYEARTSLRQAGLEGLVPQKRGPKRPRKLTPEVRRYLEELLDSEPDLKAAALVQRIRTRFGIVLHPRTVEKAVRKKGRQTP
jgi:transposase